MEGNNGGHRFFEQHWNDEQGRPGGGVSSGRGFTVSWQNGPLGRGEERNPPNGAQVEDVILVAIGRLEYYQQSEFNCMENAQALTALQMAAEYLDNRTKDREKREVEGEHKQ